MKDNIGSYGKIEETYNFITQKKDKHILAYDVYVYVGLDGYRTKWLAYKNKEQAEGIDEIKRFAEYVGSKIAGHGDYHGDSILSALYCAAEGKEISDIKPLEAKGEIVELPCSKGDKVYLVQDLPFNEITTYEITGIYYKKGEIYVDANNEYSGLVHVPFGEFCRNYDEAKKCLAELKGELRK